MRCSHILMRLFNGEYTYDKRCCQGLALLHEKILLLGMLRHTSYQPPDCNSIEWLVRSVAMTSQCSRQELLAVFISRV